MKLNCACVLVAWSSAVAGSSTASAFVPSVQHQRRQHRSGAVVGRQLNMFGGAGEAMPTEDDPEALKKMEEAARGTSHTVATLCPTCTFQTKQILNDKKRN